MSGLRAQYMTARQRAWLLPPSALFLIAGILLGREMTLPLFPLLACLPAVCAVLFLRGWFRFSACMILCLSLGAVAGQSAWHPVLPPEGEYEVRGIISDEIRRGTFDRMNTVLTDVSLNGRPFPGGVYWSCYPEELPDNLFPGREVVFQASLYYPSASDNPDGFDFREELLRRGVTVCVYGDDKLCVSTPSSFSFAGAAASLRARLSGGLIECMGEETGAYTAALLLGQRSMIPSEDRAAFAKLGIAHILSVSGFHTGILIALLSGLFRLLRLRPRIRFVLYSIILLLYCGLCGMSQPVIRASLLLLLSLAGKLLNRPRIGFHMLCAVLLVMLLFSPVQLTGVSFQLTFGAMLGITLVLPTLDGLNPFRKKIPRYLWSYLSLMLSAQLGILLPELYHYQKLPLLSLLVGLPASLLSSAVIAVDWIVLLLLPFPFLRSLPAAAASLLTSLMVYGVRAVSVLRGITLWTRASTVWTALGIIPVWIALCSFFNLSRFRRILCLVIGSLAVCVSLISFPHRETEYIQFSVGNADAAVIWDQDSVYVMDTGDADGVLSGFLRRNRLIPDAVILTHLHRDHAAGLQSMLDDEIPVPVIYLPEGAEDQMIHEDILALLEAYRSSGTEIRTLSRGDRLPLPSGSLSVLWPEKHRIRPNQDANNYSLVARLTLQEVTLLQAGDITGSYEMYCAQPADILKAPHHGSASSSSPGFISVVQPQAVILSCSRVSRHEEYSGRAGSVPVYSTAEGGTLAIRFSAGSFSITPYVSRH